VAGRCLGKSTLISFTNSLAEISTVEEVFISSQTVLIYAVREAAQDQPTHL
jgi:hypothetical protein